MLETLRTFLDSNPHGASAIYVFGSVARGTTGPSSDVDVAVLWPVDPPLTLEGPAEMLAASIERLLQGPVDLITLNRAPADLVHRVLRDGVLVLDRDPAARIRFEVQARNEYFDLLPLLRRYRRLHSGDPTEAR